jgi:GTP-binding protein HflX
LSAVFGSLRDLKPSQRARVERLGSKRIAADCVLTHDLCRRMTELSWETGRQLGVLIDRRGAVRKALVGDARSLTIPTLDGRRVGHGRLRGLRLLHTHLDGAPLDREDLTDLAMLRLDMIVAIAVEEEGLPGPAHIAHLLPPNASGEVWRILDPIHPSLIDMDFLAFVKALEDEIGREVRARSVPGAEERAILVGKTSGPLWEIEESLKELEDLARSCQVEVVGKAIQRREFPDPRYVVGRGKLQEIVIEALQCGAGMLVFDVELSPDQVRSVGDFTELKVIDRSQLILDIFARRARTADGKVQVELAQLKYALPRLGEKDDALSRLTGGIGGRGPGETKLEIDRRRIRARIQSLEKQTALLGARRAVRRRLRGRNRIPIISIVGYTNAGKSTLLNTLTKSDILAEDKLFATLDPTSRRLRFPRDTEVIITDTVGFIQDLPQTLVGGGGGGPPPRGGRGGGGGGGGRGPPPPEGEKKKKGKI